MSKKKLNFLPCWNIYSLCFLRLKEIHCGVKEKYNNKILYSCFSTVCFSISRRKLYLFPFLILCFYVPIHNYNFSLFFFLSLVLCRMLRSKRKSKENCEQKIRFKLIFTIVFFFHFDHGMF